MRRREVSILAATMAWTWPSLAQVAPAAPTVGFLSVRSAADSGDQVAAFREGLREVGFVDGQTVTVAYAWGEGSYERVKVLAAELIGLRPSVVAGFGPVPALALKQFAGNIPVVFTSSADPVAAGLVASLNRPGGNVTGISLQSAELNLKRLELLQEIFPAADTIASFVNPGFTGADAEIQALQDASEKVKRRLIVYRMTAEAELTGAYSAVRERGAKALIVNGDAFFNRMRAQMIALSAAHELPTIYPWTDYVQGGGLVSYGPSLSDGFRQAGTYVARILKGALPAELPVLQPVKFELAINMKTARALRIDIPAQVLARADEVIE